MHIDTYPLPTPSLRPCCNAQSVQPSESVYRAERPKVSPDNCSFEPRSANNAGTDARADVWRRETWLIFTNRLIEGEKLSLNQSCHWPEEEFQNFSHAGFTELQSLKSDIGCGLVVVGFRNPRPISHIGSRSWKSFGTSNQFLMIGGRSIVHLKFHLSSA